MLDILFFFYFFIFIISLFLGSFLGVVVDRFYSGEQFLKGRSHCDSCNHVLGAFDLIPVLSFIMNGGKCRYCKKVLSPTLLVFEIITGLTFSFFSYYAVLFNLPLIAVSFGVLLLVNLLIIFFSDLKYSVIYDPNLWILLVLYLLLGSLYVLGFDLGTFFSFYNNILAHITSGVWLFCFFALLYYGSKKKAMGDGDMYLAGFLGLYLSISQSIVMWFIAFLTGALVGVILLVLKRKKIKQAIPFGPFIIIGFVFAFLYGDLISMWYLGLLSN